MINYLSFDIEDWFQVENFKFCVSPKDWDKYELRVVENTNKILTLLSTHDTKATFFVLGWIAKNCPALVREIHRQGHEIASHGFGHELVYNQTPEEFEADVRLSKELLEGIIHTEIIGYRAPCFSITQDSLWAFDILKKVGFRYDSSVFPTSFHDRYGFEGMGNFSKKFNNGLLEIPISTFRLSDQLQLPLGGGGYFRLFPYLYFKSLFKILNKRREKFVFYMHPWELDIGQPRVHAPFLFRVRHYVNIKSTAAKLEKLLNDFRFQPLNRIEQLS